MLLLWPSVWHFMVPGLPAGRDPAAGDAILTLVHLCMALIGRSSDRLRAHSGGLKRLGLPPDVVPRLPLFCVPIHFSITTLPFL